MSLNNHLKSLLDQEKIADENKEAIVQITCLDNLDLGCSLIRKAVMEKALEDVN
jgi:CCR4-NOT transcription complex subunit 1